MQLNRKLLHCMYELLEAIEKSGERRFYNNKCPEVARIGTIVVDEIIASQFPGENKDDDSIRHAATSIILQHIQLYTKS